LRVKALRFFLIFLVLALASCALFRDEATESILPPGEAMYLRTSYYGDEFANQTTANGESFNPRALTAAHRLLPFGTKLRVTNPRTGRSVVVRINDRGPYITGRDLDLSEAAASAIGIRERGVAWVKVEIVGRISP